MTPAFSESAFREILEMIQVRAGSFINHRAPSGLSAMSRPIFLRFDVDDDFRKSFEASCICNEYGIQATFFILNTAAYWRDASLFRFLNEMQDKGHEIAWHNNALAELWRWRNEYQQLHDKSEDKEVKYVKGLIKYTLERFKGNDIIIRGSASHGDAICRKLGFINYEIFEECPRTSEAANFPKPSISWPRVKMADFGLEYEAYHVPYDLYLSESGGREWTSRSHGNEAQPIGMEMIKRAVNNYDRIQILIHPQHWKI